MRIFLLFITGWLVAGCGSGYPTFYTLSAEGSIPSSKGVGIGVGPVILAEYLDRPNLVIKTGANRIEVAEKHLWAGDLDDSISRVLSVNLGRELNTGNVRVYPWTSDREIDFQIAMDVSEFIAADDGYVYLNASWRIYSLPGRRMIGSDTFAGKEPISRENFDSMVAAQSRLLGRLSKDIATGIRKRR